MTTRIGYGVLLVFHTLTIVLLLHIAFKDSSAPVDVSLSSKLTDSVEPAPTPNNYGLTNEDVARTRELKRDVISRYQISTPTLRSRRSIEIDDISDQLRSQLKRYQTMSEQQKKQLERRLADEISNSEEVGEVIRRISKALDDAFSSSSPGADDNSNE